MAGLYIHIPFCVRKCAYCDFLSFPQAEAQRELYLSALGEEIRLAGRLFPAQGYETVFVGGGTPSILKPGEVRALFQTLRQSFSILPDAEITLECNPGTLSQEKLEEYRASGVNRLSLGLQSAEEKLLQEIGRIHSFPQFLDSFRMARQAGFGNINVDIMYGLPGQDKAQFLSTIEQVAALGPEHISAYCLILEEGTPLYERVGRGETRLPHEDVIWDMEQAGRAALAALGYVRYEISNYAKKGFACRHNMNYWENGPIWAWAWEHIPLCAWVVGGRWENTRELESYFQAIRQGRLPIQHQERIEEKEEMFECLMLGLRMLKGVDRAAFQARFGRDLCTVYPEAVEALCAIGWAEVQPDAFMLTEAGLDMENSALLYFLED